MRPGKQLKEIEAWVLTEAKTAHDEAIDASRWDSGLFVALCGRAEAFEETLEFIQTMRGEEWESNLLVE